MNKVLLAYERGYRVSKDGTLYSNKGIVQGLEQQGYRILHFGVNNKDIRVRVHRLQAYQKFGSKMFEHGIVVRHLNGNSLDNSWDNINIGTQSDNISDRSEINRISHAIKGGSGKRRFTDDEVSMILKDKSYGMTYKDLCKKYDTSKSTLSYLFNEAYYTGQRKIQRG